MDIQPATPDDIPQLSRLNAEVQRLHVEHHPEVFKLPESDAFAEDFFREMLQRPDTCAFIGEVSGEAVGYILLRILDNEEHLFAYASRYLEINQIGVSQAHRGRGYGVELIQKAVEVAREKDIGLIALATWAFNKPAQKFFASQGFEFITHRMWLKLDE